MQDSPERCGFLLTPEFPLAPVAAAIDTLALANYVGGRSRRALPNSMISIRFMRPATAGR
ncbi:MAG: hypothetical protein CMM46_17975 [Rhodospirillaceae bacterium]|nr:hypothetical protein [Rhodospirillaceae bacterium]|tara:strand:- start:18093 stop:18272 length:180 start_codon:yes stop_codon:yes gene_type:complete